MAERLSREAVVARAADLADEIGLHEVTLTRLARALGISGPGVYRHVDGLPDLRSAIGALAAREVAAELGRASAGLSGRAALGAVSERLRAWAAAHPGRYRALQVAPDPESRAEAPESSRAEEAAAAAAAVIDALANALRAYALAGDDLTDAIRILRATIHGFAQLELDGGFRMARPLDATIGRALDGLDAQFLAWGAVEQGR